MIGSLGEGGFAVVHKMELMTEDRTSKEVVAVKKLKPGVIEDDKDLKELIQESNVLRKLKHRYSNFKNPYFLTILFFSKFWSLF